MSDAVPHWYFELHVYSGLAAAAAGVAALWGWGWSSLVVGAALVVVGFVKG